MYNPPPPPPGSPPGYRPPTGYGQPYYEPVNNGLVPAILVTIFCCQLGIVAVIFAAQVEPKLEGGNYAGAVEAAEKAKKWTLITLFVTLGLYAVLFIFYALMIAGAIVTSSG